MSERIRPPESARSRLQQFVSLVRGLGVSAQAPADGLPVPLPPLGPKREAVSRWCAERGLDRRPWVVLHPGSSPAQQFKRWPAPRFAEVGRRLLARSVGVAISWGPGEEALAREVEAGCGGGAALAPAGDLLDLAALIAAARAFVGNDTGPMHLSWAVGTPVVGLFGPTDPALNAPPGEAHRILYAGPPRRPGERRPRRPLYLEQIRPEEVEAAVLEVLERAGSARQGAAHWPGDLRELPTEPGR